MKRALLVTEMARLETLMGKERQQATTRSNWKKRYVEDCICVQHAIEAGILQGYPACF
jgi:hypothetical protein